MPDAVSIVCPHCDAVARLAAVTFAGGEARCGSCGSLLFDGRPAALADAVRFQKHMVSNDVPVLVLFCAPWCGPCRVMAPDFERAALMLEPRMRLATLDIDKASDVAARHGVRSIPTMILFSGGRELGRQSGAVRAAGIAAFVLQRLRAVNPAAQEA